MPCLDHSLPPLRVTMLKLELQQEREECLTQHSAPPTLLYWIQMGSSPMISPSPRSSRLMSQHMLGSRVDETNIPFYEIPSVRHSNSSKPTQLILKQSNNILSTNQTVLSSQIQSRRILSLAEQSTSMPQCRP